MSGAERSSIERSGGGPLPDNHRELDPGSGQQKAYVVLTAEERAKGYVRPVRCSYVHVGANAQWDGAVLVKLGEGGCGTLTTMARDIAETYAREPAFYGGTFCVGCRKHLPLAGFVWDGSREIVGS